MRQSRIYRDWCTDWRTDTTTATDRSSVRRLKGAKMAPQRPPADKRSAADLQRRRMRALNARRASFPKCGARRKRDGLPCQRLAMENGRCDWHGGKTPRGDEWHKPQFSPAPSKMYRKLDDLDRRAAKRAKRVAAMTPEERERYEAWKRTHRPGAAKARAAARERRRQAREAHKPLTAADTRPSGEKRATGPLWPTTEGVFE